jgi:hypothetical protein
MDIKYSTLQRKLSASEKREQYLKERVSTWRTRALKEREMLKGAIVQYERIIKQWRKMYEDVIGNGWKIVFVKIVNWYNKKRGIKTL